jgi:uncharacterized membrane protein YkvA (DUF1232 family)
MSLEITFEFSESEIAHFRKILAEARERSKDLEREEIIQNARKMLLTVRASGVCEFIRNRVNRLETMIGMVVDKAWALEEEDAQRVLSALAYFSDPEDLIPDNIPVLGFLDDAIMVELVTRELHHDIEAYRDFVVFRAAESGRLGEDAMKIGRSEWLEERRKQLHARMRRRRGMGRQGSGSSLF